MLSGDSSIFWLAFGGLSLGLLACAALIADARAKSVTEARLMRAAGRAKRRHALTGEPDAPLLTRARVALLTVIARMGERLSVLLGGEASKTAADLRSAGFKDRDALMIYAFAKTLLPLATAVIGIAWVMLTRAPHEALMIPIATKVAAALAISKGVDIALDTMRRNRLNRIRAGVPDLLELLVITSEAGLGPQPALQRVAREIAAAHPELSTEVLQMVAEMRMTNDRRSAYESLSDRVPLPEIGVFTQTLDQSDRYGTPFSKAMKTLMAEMRSDRLLRVEEKAARLPVIMTVPLIFCIMPAVFVVLIGPAAISIIDNIFGAG